MSGDPDALFLLTGFGAFPGVPDNPTELLITALASRWRDDAPGEYRLETHILPTEYAAVDDWVATRLSVDARAPRLFLMLGYSSVADRLKLETRASNIRASDLADAADCYPTPSQSPLRHLPTGLPLGQISESLGAAHIPHSLSDDCGQYVCNHLFYRALDTVDGATTCTGFVHIPPLHLPDGRFVPDVPERARPFDEILTGVELIAQSTIATLSPRS